MKNGLFALYHGKEYSSGKNRNGKYILRSTTRDDLIYGFQECEPFYYKKNEELIVCYKYVERDDIEEYYSVRTLAKYQGYIFEVLEEVENQISIVTMVGDYKEWQRIGMKCIDKGVYQKWIDKNEAEISIEKEYL